MNVIHDALVKRCRRFVIEQRSREQNDGHILLHLLQEFDGLHAIPRRQSVVRQHHIELPRREAGAKLVRGLHYFGSRVNARLREHAQRQLYIIRIIFNEENAQAAAAGGDLRHREGLLQRETGKSRWFRA